MASTTPLDYVTTQSWRIDSPTPFGVHQREQINITIHYWPTTSITSLMSLRMFQTESSPVADRLEKLLTLVQILGVPVQSSRERHVCRHR